VKLPPLVFPDVTHSRLRSFLENIKLDKVGKIGVKTLRTVTRSLTTISIVNNANHYAECS
jgi:hypothetical protein